MQRHTSHQITETHTKGTQTHSHTHRTRAGRERGPRGSALRPRVRTGTGGAGRGATPDPDPRAASRSSEPSSLAHIICNLSALSTIGSAHQPSSETVRDARAASGESSGLRLSARGLRGPRAPRTAHLRAPQVRHGAAGARAQPRARGARRAHTAPRGGRAHGAPGRDVPYASWLLGGVIN